MAEHEIIWNSRSSLELGVHIISEPPYDIAVPSVTSNHILGKNGDILTEVYDFANSERQYQMSFELYGYPFTERCGEVLKWLCGEYMKYGAHTYSELYDSYNPNIYYLACFKPGGEMNKTLGANASLGSYTAAFTRRPERFYISGKDMSEEKTITNGSSGITVNFVNPTIFASEPSFTISSIPANSSACVSVDHYGASKYTAYTYKILIKNTATTGTGYLRHDPYRHVYTRSNGVTYQILCKNPNPFDTSNTDPSGTLTHWHQGSLLLWPGPNSFISEPPPEGGSAVTGMTISLAGHWWTL